MNAANATRDSFTCYILICISPFFFIYFLFLMHFDISRVIKGLAILHFFFFLQNRAII